MAWDLYETWYHMYIGKQFYFLGGGQSCDNCTGKLICSFNNNFVKLDKSYEQANIDGWYDQYP